MCKKQVIKKLLLVQNDLTKRLFKSIIDTQLKIDCDLRLCWNWQTGKLEVLVSERVYGFESRWPHQIWTTKKILSEKTPDLIGVFLCAK